MRPFRCQHALAIALAIVVPSTLGCGREDSKSKRDAATQTADAAAIAAPVRPSKAGPAPQSAELPWVRPAPKPKAAVHAAGGLPLGISLSTTAPIRHPTTLSSGIPFPRGQVASVDHLRLEALNGVQLPAQFNPLAWWPDGSLKATLVTAPVDSSPVTQSLMLRHDPSAATPAPTTTLRVEEERDGILVTTGPTRFRVGRKRFHVFDQVWVDADSNGEFTDAEAVLRAPGEIFLIKTGDQREFRASADPKPEVVVEESGPIRAVIRASGWLRDERGESLSAFRVRIIAYAGQEQVRVDYTLIDPREEADVTAHRKGPAFQAAGYGLRLPLALGEPAYGLFGGDRMQGYQAYSGPLADSQHIFQHGSMNYVDGTLQPYTFYYDGVGKGERADGWIDASDDRIGVAAMVRYFWQQFPKELAVVNRDLLVYLHPPRATTLEDPEPPGGWSKRYRRPKTFYFLREGGAKTYQLQFVFHRGKGDSDILQAIYDNLQNAPRMVASTGWMCRSGVFGDLAESDQNSGGYDSSLVDDIYARSIEQKRDTGGLAFPYGWRDFGDRMRPGWEAVHEGTRIPGFYNDTHVGAHTFFVQYLRTGDLRWYELGELASRHWMDLDVSHANRMGYWKRDGKYAGFGPGEGYMIKHDMIDHDARNMHLGHAHISGLVEYYLLTGDQRAYEVIREVGDWWAKASQIFFGLPVKWPHFAEAERDFGWPLYVLNQAYQVTGDEAYHRAAARIVQHLIEWWQIPTDHYLNGKVVGHNDWKQGTGWWAMYPRSDNSPEPPQGKTLYNGTNPWMAGALLSAVIKFHEADRDMQLIDDKLTETMVLQCMNYVVKHGWNPEKRFFIYSEAARDTDGGSTHLLYPLAYCWRRLQQGGVEHPELYDTAPLWREIAQARHADMQVVRPRSTTDSGFYGYEMVFPADFFQIMQELERGGAPSAPAAVPTAVQPTTR